MDIIRRAILESLGLGQHGHPEQPLELDETILDKNALKAIMMAGGPGSGKSYVVKQLATAIHPMPKVVDSDKIFEAKLKSANLPATLATPDTPEREAQTVQREKASAVNVKVLHNMLNGFLPIIIDATGKNLDKFTKQKQTLEALGYDVMCLMVNTSLEVAQQRNAERKRKLTPPEVEKIWKMCQENFPKYPDVFKYSLTVNNDPGKLDTKQLIAGVKKFLESPVQNPIGQELFANKDKGSIVRQIPRQDISTFD